MKDKKKWNKNKIKMPDLTIIYLSIYELSKNKLETISLFPKGEQKIKEEGRKIK